MFAEHRRLNAIWLAAGNLHGDDSPEDKAAWAAYMAMEDRIETTVASTPEGVAAQIEYLKVSYGDPHIEPPDRPTVDGVPYQVLDVILEGLRRIGA